MGDLFMPLRRFFLALIFLICFCGFVATASGADASIEGYLGDTITLHGVSYVGDTVYLFLTGPNLPADGVTLTDISQRADQGHFTIVPVDDNQEWTYSWQTSRIEPTIDPGTYTVYVTNEPVDFSNLGSTSSYKTLSVYLRDSGVSKVSIDAGHSYTLRPESHSSPVPETTSPPATTIPEQSPSVVITVTMLQETPAIPAASPTKAGLTPCASLVAVALGCLVVFHRH